MTEDDGKLSKVAEDNQKRITSSLKPADIYLDTQHSLSGGVLHLKQRPQERPALRDVAEHVAHVVVDCHLLKTAEEKA